MTYEKPLLSQLCRNEIYGTTCINYDSSGNIGDCEDGLSDIDIE